MIVNKCIMENRLRLRMNVDNKSNHIEVKPTFTMYLCKFVYVWSVDINKFRLQNIMPTGNRRTKFATSQESKKSKEKKTPKKTPIK